jgi:hypothetical protein
MGVEYGLPITSVKMEKQVSFDKDISLYWHCEVRDQFAASDLKSALADKRHPMDAEDFRQMLAEVIRTRRYSLKQYEAMTGLDFESVDEVADDLRELWRLMYGADVEQP